MGQVPRLPLLPCLGESAPDNTLLSPLPLAALAPALPWDYLIGCVWWESGAFSCRGEGIFTLAFLGQTSNPALPTHKGSSCSETRGLGLLLVHRPLASE